VRDNPDHPAANLQSPDGVRHRPKGFRVEGAEAFVNEQAVKMDGPSGFLDLFTQGEGEGEGREEQLATAECLDPTTLASIVVVNDKDALILECEPVAVAGQAGELA